MSTLSLPFATRARPGYARPIAERAGGIPLDLRSSRIHMETDRGLVVAFYVDAKPRQDAIVDSTRRRQLHTAASPRRR